MIVAGKQPAPQWLTMDEAIKHCTAGIGIWEWASNDQGGEPDVVMACCGDVPTLETLAAVDLLRQHVPELKIRVDQRRRPDEAAAAERAPARPDRPATSTRCSPRDKPIIFAFHGYPWLIHRLTYRRDEPRRTCTCAATRRRARRRRRSTWWCCNDLDRFHLVERRDRPRAAARRAGRLRQAGDPRQADRAQAVHRRARRRHAGDRDWRWDRRSADASRAADTAADNV